MTMDDDGRPDAIEDLKRRLSSAQLFIHPSDHLQKQKTANRLIAENVLSEDLGLLKGEFEKTPLHLDQAVKDRLLTGIRCDAGHALLNTITLMSDVWAMKRAVFTVYNLVVLAVLAGVVFFGIAFFT
jgi:hypothetical protein